MKSYKIAKEAMLIYFATIIFIFKTVLSSSRLIVYSDSTDQVIAFIGAASLLVFIIEQKYKLKMLLIYVVILLLTAYNAWVTGNSALIITLLTCLSIRKLNIEQYIAFVFKCEVWLLLAHTILAMALSLNGVISITQSIGGVKRYNFGLLHPNTVSAFIFNILLMWVWLNWSKIKNRNIVFITLLTFLTYFLCKTRTTLLDALIIIILLVCRRFEFHFDSVIEKVTKWIVPILTVLMAFLISMYSSGSHIVMVINEVLNARIGLGAYALAHYGLSFWGQDLSELYVNMKWDKIWQLNTFTFDSIYSYMLVNQGIIWLLIATVLFYKMAKQHQVRNNVALLSWALYGLTEVQGLNCFSCFPLLLIAYLLQKDKR